jgi:hypothetical protein
VKCKVAIVIAFGATKGLFVFNDADNSVTDDRTRDSSKIVPTFLERPFSHSIVVIVVSVFVE